MAKSLSGKRPAKAGKRAWKRPAARQERQGCRSGLGRNATIAPRSAAPAPAQRLHARQESAAKAICPWRLPVLLLLFFASVLIAAKPVKPCDGGVFGALDLLLKTERNVAGAGGVGIGSGEWAGPVDAFAPCGQTPQAGSWTGCQPVSTAACVAQSLVDFAPALIAAKPVKPCDGGVFGGLGFAPFFGAKRAGSSQPQAGRPFCCRPISLRFDWVLQAEVD